MKAKAKAKIAEKDSEIKELSKKSEEESSLIQTLTANYQEASSRLLEKEKKVSEQEEALASYNSVKSKYEYKINFLEEKMKKAGIGEEQEQKIRDFEAKVSEQ